MDDDGPLAGVKVVELSMYVQGPVAGLTLASLGADVVKIEQVGTADHMRGFRSAFGVEFDDRGREWMYASLNRNKRALALDIASDDGRGVFERLIEQADVFVTNLRESGLTRFRADPETLMAINPRLVYCRGAGFGLRGPMADDPCQDTVGMAYAGFMDSTSPSDVPNYPPGSMSDILTGSNLASGAMAGLLKRSVTGKGCVVGTSQTQALLWLQLQAVGIAANVGARMERFAPDATTNPLFTVYQTADGWIAIAAIQSSHWPLIARGVGTRRPPRRPAVRQVRRGHRQPRGVPGRVRAPHAHADDCALVAGAAGRRCLGRAVNRLEDLAQDENILANDYLTTFDDGFIGPPAPFEVDGFRGVRGLAAAYGEHSDAVLAELGYAEEQITELRGQGGHLVAGADWRGVGYGNGTARDRAVDSDGSTAEGVRRAGQDRRGQRIRGDARQRGAGRRFGLRGGDRLGDLDDQGRHEHREHLLPPPVPGRDELLDDLGAVGRSADPRAGHQPPADGRVARQSR